MQSHHLVKISSFLKYISVVMPAVLYTGFRALGWSFIHPQLLLLSAVAAAAANIWSLSLSLSLCVSYFQAPSCNQIADNLLADIIKLFLYNNCALDEKFLRKKFSSSTTLQGWSSHTGMFVLDGFGNFMPNERIFHMWLVKKISKQDAWWELMKFIALKVVVPSCWMNQYSLTSMYIQVFSCVRGFLASQTLNNDLTVWKYQQTSQLQSTENCMK
jgi:hypothetical protein